jgi:hypothetical protein
MSMHVIGNQIIDGKERNKAPYVVSKKEPLSFQNVNKVADT